MMIFGEVEIYCRFTIAEEDSIFYKECNRYDGACNAYKVKDKYNDNILEPVIFPKNYNVIQIEP